ncbi:MAG: (Fe-S)-binding protein [Deltaproteobacteria bacterium]|jgi:Fe-S oxidoreductase|nr:(Fe-S)-binding protein [Deltaproteobacteria bacterium]MBW2536498.1 (Fe-S)-binding protein [Deltaproteobacteria bacterium]
MESAHDSKMLYWTDGELDLAFARRLGPRAEDLRTCVQCGSCTASCPTAISMAVSPQRLGRLIRLGMEREALRSGSYWQCTSCDACSLHCPRGISMMEIIVELKRYARQRRLPPPDEVRLLCEAVRNTKNISGDPNEDRLRWTANLPQPLGGIDRVPDADLLYFVGCIASFYPRAYGIAQGFGRILNLAGLRFTTLGGEEWCCGYPLVHAGMHDEVGTLIEHNLARVRRLGLRTLVTTCPSCFYTWKVLYPRFASMPPDLTILHSTQLLAELLEGRRLRPSPHAQSVTYHDPCDLARKCGELEAPRTVLRSLPGVELREMANSGMNALCCGGGGDVKLLDVDTTLDVARRRVEQAVDVGADTVVSACQQCKRALVGAVQWMRKPMKAVDIVELVWMTLADEVEW